MREKRAVTDMAERPLLLGVRWFKIELSRSVAIMNNENRERW